MIKVGSFKIWGQRYPLYTYNNVIYDIDGWADVNYYLPNDFDIVMLRVKNIHKPIPGWYTGRGWDGLKWNDDYEVLQWKKENECKMVLQ